MSSKNVDRVFVPETVSIIQSERGHGIAVDSLQYMYHQNACSKDGKVIYWECIDRKKKNCKCRLHTKSASDNYEVIKFTQDHTHSASKDRVDCKRVHGILKYKAMASSDQSSRALVDECTSELDEYTRSQLSHSLTLSRNVRNWRQKSQTKSTPQNISELVTTDSLLTLKSGEKFLQYDSGIDSESRLLIFATENGLRDLKMYKEWSIVCAYDNSSNQKNSFHLVVFYASIEDSVIPRAFAILSKKSESAITQLYSTIKDMVEFDPVSITGDFDLESMAAAVNVFPTASYQGCFYRFTQNLYRKIVNLGYQQKYHNNNEFCLTMRHFSALSFIPFEDVVEGFEILSGNSEIPREFISYFELTFLGIERGFGQDRKRDTPTFPIPIWNLNYRLKDAFKLSEDAEAIYTSMNRVVSDSQSNLMKLVNFFKNEEILAKAKMIKIEQGENLHFVKKYKDTSSRIKDLVYNYDGSDKLSFLRSLAYDLHVF